VDKIDIILKMVKVELLDATNKFGAFHNAHEAYAVLLEEVDELWDEVKRKQREGYERLRRMQEEAIQVAAMAVRLVLDCCSGVRKSVMGFQVFVSDERNVPGQDIMDFEEDEE
jgi:hypothetical protein